MAILYGSDTFCVTDLPLIDQQITDPFILIGQRMVRRLTTPRGALALIGDDPNFGWDVRQYINHKFSSATKITAQAQIQNELLKDEQVLSVQCQLTLVNSVLTIALSGVLSPGPFTLTFGVTTLAVSSVVINGLNVNVANTGALFNA